MRKLRMTKNRLTAFMLVFAMLFTCIQPSVVAEAAGQTEDSTESVRGADIDNPTAGKWSYIYFGSYPQTEVTGDDLTDAIKKAEYNTNGDATVDGNKYRRIYTKRLVGFDFTGTDNYLYFKWEPIRWRVLQKTDDELFIMSDIGLDNMPYRTESTTATWDNSQMRKWLNGEDASTVYEPGYITSPNFSYQFYSYSSQEESGVTIQYVKDDAQEKIHSFYTTAFNDEQRSTIVEKESDRIFLLSATDVQNASYGFGSTDRLRTLQASSYSHKKGSKYYLDNNNWYQWWLKSDATYPDLVEFEGTIATSYANVDEQIYTCAPAMYISLSSDQWLSEAEMLQQEKDSAIKTLEDYRSAEDYRRAERKEWAAAVADGKDAIDQAKSLSAVASALEAAIKKIDGLKTDAQYRVEERGNLDEMELNPVHHHNVNGDEDTTDWKYIYMGSYPQTEVTDEALIERLREASKEQGSSADVILDGEKYKYRSGYYYKWEPIKWRILENEENTLFVCADLSLEQREYSGIPLFGNVLTDWNNSRMREYLYTYSSSIYNTAFIDEEKDAIVPYNIGGQVSNIYLLTEDEVTNESYGFCSDTKKASSSRQMEQSDYCNATGRIDSVIYLSLGGWWLRSEVDWKDKPATDTTAKMLAMVSSETDSYGSISATPPYRLWNPPDNYKAYLGGIVPALRVSKNSAYWSFEKPDKGLQYMKDVAIAELEAYLEEQDNYSEEQQKKRETIITEGITAIEAAEDENEVTAALSAAKEALGNIEAETFPGLKEEKEKVNQQISAWNDPNFLALYDEEEQEKIVEIADKLAEDITGETDKEKIEELLNQAKAEVEALPTKEQKAEERADECLKKLNEYESKLADYDEADKAELAELLEDTKSKVEAALKDGDLEAAEDALAEMEAALEEKAAGKKEEAKKELDDIRESITEDKDLEEFDESQRAEIEAEINEALDAAKEEIENAKDATAVKEVLEKVTQTIEDIKQKARDLNALKEEVGNQISAWNEDDFLAQYGEEEREKIKEIADELGKDIAGKTEPSEVQELLDQAKAAVAAIKTEKQKELEKALNQTRDAALKELEDLESKLGEYRDAEQEKIKKAIAEAKAKIEAAENEDAVKEALEAAKQVFKEQPTDAELKKQEEADKKGQGGTGDKTDQGGTGDKPPTASLSLDKTAATLYTGKVSNSVTVKATVTGTSKTVTWQTSNPKVATVKDGKITAVGKGTATVTATANGITKSVQVTVKNPTITIKNGKKKFTKSKLTVKRKKKVVLTVTVNPKNSGISITKLTKKQKKIASVTLKKGKITIKGKQKGSFTLQIKSGKATKKIKITVK